MQCCLAAILQIRTSANRLVLYTDSGMQLLYETYKMTVYSSSIQKMVLMDTYGIWLDIDN